MAEITIIIPSYNMPDGVIRAVYSVLSQNIDMNVVVVDDCSDPPLELPDQILEDDRIKLIRQPENKGVSAARNLGVENSQPPWLTFLDSDDQLLPDTLYQRLQFAKDSMHQLAHETGHSISKVHSNAFVCCGWIDPVHAQGFLETRIPNPANTPEEFASGCWYSSGSCALFHRSFFDAPDRKYDENLRRLEDFDWGIRAGLSGARMISHPIAGVSIKPSNKTNLQAIKTVTAQILENFSYLRKSQPKIYASMAAYLALEQATFSFRENKWLGAAFELARSYMARPRLRRHFSPGWTYEKYKTAVPKDAKS